MSELPPSDQTLAPPAPPYRDRRTGLILFGILEILLGALCLLMAGFAVLAQMMLARTTGVPVDAQMLILAALFYVGLAAAFIWLGVGSLQCRRWARALLLILAWAWLCTGLLAVPMMAWIMPRILASAPAGGQALPPGTMAIVVVVQLVFVSVFFILLPGALVLFYRSQHVKDTCEARDPIRRWTDECPLPVLGGACLVGWGAVVMLGLSLTKFTMFPFFGILLTRLPATLLMIVMACVSFWIARSWYRLKMAGWWALMVWISVMTISNALTFARVDILEVYQKLGYPQAQIDMIQQQGWFGSGFLLWNSLIWVLPMLGYALWVKRFFRATS